MPLHPIHIPIFMGEADSDMSRSHTHRAFDAGALGPPPHQCAAMLSVQTRLVYSKNNTQVVSGGGKQTGQQAGTWYLLPPRRQH